jgi:hypothetical protein
MNYCLNNIVTGGINELVSIQMLKGNKKIDIKLKC